MGKTALGVFTSNVVFNIQECSQGCCFERFDQIDPVPQLLNKSTRRDSESKGVSFRRFRRFELRSCEIAVSSSLALARWGNYALAMEVGVLKSELEALESKDRRQMIAFLLALEERDNHGARRACP